jgi:NIPSNAP
VKSEEEQNMSAKWFSVLLLTLIVVVVVAVIPTNVAQAQAQATTKPAGTAPGGRVFEMRKYYTLPGRLDALNARFRNHTTKLFEKHGMQNIGYWMPTEGAEAGRVLVYILAYPSMEAKDAAWKGFRNDPDWKKVREESEQDGKIVEKIESTILGATDYSAIK